MSLMERLSKPIGKGGGKSGGKAAASPKGELVRAEAGRRAPSAALSPVAPRARLLPPEVAQGKRAAALQSRIRVVAILVIAMVVAAVAASYFYSGAAAARLAAAESDSTTLQAKVRSYAGLEKMANQIAILQAAQKVGGAADIDWAAYLGKLYATVPSGVSISSLNITSKDIQGTASTSGATSSTTAPVATINMQVVASNGAALPSWIDSLSTLPGYLGAQTGAVTSGGGSNGASFSGNSGGGGSGYAATVTLTVGPDALSHRYVTSGAKK